MTGFTSTAWLPFGMTIHILFVLAVLSAVVLLIVWAVKNLSKKTLLTAALWLLVIGLLGSYLTWFWGMQGMMTMMGGWSENGTNGGMMNNFNNMMENSERGK